MGGVGPLVVVEGDPAADASLGLRTRLPSVQIDAFILQGPRTLLLAFAIGTKLPQSGLTQLFVANWILFRFMIRILAHGGCKPPHRTEIPRLSQSRTPSHIRSTEQVGHDNTSPTRIHRFGMIALILLEISMSKPMYPSNIELRATLDQLTQRYLTDTDASHVMALFDQNPLSGKEILHILVSEKLQESAEKDQKALKVLAHNFGI